MAFELKANMKLAPQCRVNVDSLPDRMAQLDKLLPAQVCVHLCVSLIPFARCVCTYNCLYRCLVCLQDTSLLYVDELRGKFHTPGSCKSTWPL
jgi:hypothetical protein